MPTTPPTTIRRVETPAHPGGANGQGLVLVAGSPGYGVMFSAALTMAFVACSIAL